MSPFRSLPSGARVAIRPLPFLALIVVLGFATVLPFRAVVNEMARDRAQPKPYVSVLPQWKGNAFKIGLVDSAATRAFYRRDPAATGEGRIPKAWRSFFESERFGYEVFSTIPAADAHGCQVLVLPSVTCVSDDELAAVRSNMEKGVGLVFTWDFGCRDAVGEWRPVSGLQVHVGVSSRSGVPEVYPAESHCEVVCLPWISDNVPTGQRLLVPRSGTPLVAANVEPRNQIVAHWVALTGRVQGEKEFSGAAMVAGTFRESRYFWMGFNLGETRERDPSSLAVKDLMRQVLTWTAQAPQMVKPSFPDGLRGGAWTGVNLRRAVRGMPLPPSGFEDGAISPVWFVDASWLENDADVRRLAERGELAILAEEGVADGWTADEMRSFRERFSALAGYDVEGIRVEGPLLDATLDHLSKAGFRYVVTRDVESALPRLVRQKRAFPVFARPRYLWLIPDAGTSAGRSTVACMTGRVYEWSDLPDGTEDASGGTLLTGTLQKIRQRWEAWSTMKVSIVQSGGSGSVLAFSNTGFLPENDVRFALWVPTNAQPRVVASTLHSPALKPTPVGDGAWEVRFKTLAAGRNHTYRLSY
jgi:hypothetical protein